MGCEQKKVKAENGGKRFSLSYCFPENFPSFKVHLYILRITFDLNFLFTYSLTAQFSL